MRPKETDIHYNLVAPFYNNSNYDTHSYDNNNNDNCPFYNTNRITLSENNGKMLEVIRVLQNNKANLEITGV